MWFLGIKLSLILIFSALAAGLYLMKRKESHWALDWLFMISSFALLLSIADYATYFLLSENSALGGVKFYLLNALYLAGALAIAFKLFKRKERILVIIALVVLYGSFAFFLLMKDSQGPGNQVSVKDKELLVRGIKDPFVKHIRVAIDNLNEGSTEGYSVEDMRQFRDYLSGKFILLAVNHQALSGGKEMQILFEDMPDKIFYVWVYQMGDGTFDLRAFSHDDRFSADEAKEIYESNKSLVEELSLAV